MNNNDATEALAALSQSTRLEAFRLLIQHAPEGLHAGEIAESLDTRQNTMSVHLGVLLRAGLVTVTREGRSMRYRAKLATMRELVGFLVQDCCGGHAEICRPMLAAALPDCD